MSKQLIKLGLQSLVKRAPAAIKVNQIRCLSFAINNAEPAKNGNNYLSTATKLSSLQLYKNNQLVQKRFKKKASGQDDDGDEEDEGLSKELDSVTPGESVAAKINVKSLKIEFVLTKSLFRSRSQFEEALSKGRLRLNGEEVKTKNVEVEELDTFDYVLGRNKDNYDLLDVNRVIIAALPDKMIKGRFDIEVEKWINLTIENYLEPWEGKTVN